MSWDLLGSCFKNRYSLNIAIAIFFSRNHLQGVKCVNFRRPIFLIWVGWGLSMAVLGHETSFDDKVTLSQYGWDCLCSYFNLPFPQQEFGREYVKVGTRMPSMPFIFRIPYRFLPLRRPRTRDHESGMGRLFCFSPTGLRRIRWDWSGSWIGLSVFKPEAVWSMITFWASIIWLFSRGGGEGSSETGTENVWSREIRVGWKPMKCSRLVRITRWLTSDLLFGDQRLAWWDYSWGRSRIRD